MGVMTAFAGSHTTTATAALLILRVDMMPEARVRRLEIGPVCGSHAQQGRREPDEPTGEDDSQQDESPSATFRHHCLFVCLFVRGWSFGGGTMGLRRKQD